MNLLLAAAAISGMVAGIGLYSAYDIVIDDPGIVAEARARCAAEVEAAAARATAAEQARQFKIGEQAFQQAYLQDQEDQDWQDARVRLLQQENDDYERERAATGKACPLDDRDLDYLGRANPSGLQHERPAH